MGNIKFPELSEVYHKPWEQSMLQVGRELGIFPKRFRLFDPTIIRYDQTPFDIFGSTGGPYITCISNAEWMNKFNEARMRKAIEILRDNGIIKPNTTEDWIYPLKINLNEEEG